MFFSVITKNLNWEILTKSLVTFKKWKRVKDKKISYGFDRIIFIVRIKCFSTGKHFHS